MKDIQFFATTLFVIASILFGLVGIAYFAVPDMISGVGQWFVRTLGILFFIMVSSLATSVACKYLFK